MCFLKHVKRHLLKNIFVRLDGNQTCLILLFGHSVKLINMFGYQTMSVIVFGRQKFPVWTVLNILN